MGPIWYPDNVHRGDRVRELRSDVVEFQENLRKARAVFDKAEGRIKRSVDAVMAQGGLLTFDQMSNHLAKILTPEQKDLYDKVRWHELLRMLTCSR